MKAKTVLDVVNELKGDLNNIYGSFHGAMYINLCSNNNRLVVSNGHPEIICTIRDFHQQVEDCLNNKGWGNMKQDSKAVYTQAMSDAGELPSARAMIEFSNDLFEVIFTYENQIWIKSKTKAISRLVHISDIKPIDTRSDKEKAIDNLMFYGDQTQTRERAEKNFNAIFNGKINCVSFTGSDS